MAGGDGDPSRRAEPADEELDGGSGADAEVAHAAAARDEAGDDGLPHHLPGRAGIAPDHDAAPSDVGAERLCEAGHQLGGERVSDHPPDAGDADLEGRDRPHRRPRPGGRGGVTPPASRPACPRPVDQLPGALGPLGLGDDPHERLRVRRAHVDPAVAPEDLHAVGMVHGGPRGVADRAAELGEGRVEEARGHGDGQLLDGEDGQRVDERGQRPPRAGEVDQQESGRRRRVRARLYLRDGDAAVAFSADHGVVFEDRLRDVGLAHGRPHHPAAVPGRHALHQAGRRHVRDHRSRAAGEGRLHGEGQRQLLGERPARLVDEAQTLAVGVEHEPDVGLARAHHCPGLGGGGDPGLRRPRERKRRVVVDGQDLAAEPREPWRQEPGAGPVEAVDDDLRTAGAHGRTVEGGAQALEVMLERVPLLDPGADPVRAHARGRALVEDVEELLALLRAQVEPVRADELEGVPLGRVVAPGDRDPSGSVLPGHGLLQAGGGAYAEIDDLAPHGEEAGGDRGLDHGARRPRITAHEHAAPVEVGAEGLGEAHHELGRERLSDDAAHAGDADLEGLHGPRRRIVLCAPAGVKPRTPETGAPSPPAVYTGPSPAMSLDALRSEPPAPDVPTRERPARGTLDDLVRFVSAHPRLLALTGAGCSTASGIPDYRDAEGAWKHPRPVSYADFVRSAAVRRRYWARSFVGWPRVGQASPNLAHLGLAGLEARGRVAQVVTQNVDGLHQKAGSRRVIDLHGRVDTVECLGCGARLARRDVQTLLRRWNPGLAGPGAALAPDGDAHLEGAQDGVRVPDCPECGGILKPAVVFFGETVPRHRVDAVMRVLEAADALLVVGSSLMVFSAYRFCLAARALGKPVAAVNRGRTRADELLALKVASDCGSALAALLARL